MRRKNPSENLTEKKSPDCSTCIRRAGCDRAQEGSFCTRWQGKEPEERKPDPNEQWMRGEDVDF